ncbi:sulfotransferase [Nocardioides sp. zg-536]|uniref:Sulfotransferase n=1 Tax=Nocardioides faecalis TaxID=2803858 RepID=A0A938Y3D3_9ACTN|nr:sulfotransferase [Nocardioides faecalis]MBM9458480.1 sulfotransferase [Nocardioides faecalis]QVI58493.1 sulfotransferase [Nocardioides faecalis]
MTRDPRPDFLLVGAPKAGTSALHLALAAHPDVFVTTPKEPKFWLCEDAPPPHWRGPGDRHSQREWIWHREAYADLFRLAPPHAARGESTPFYLWHRGAQRRIAEALPDIRLIAVVRDPIDRAYSNWMHLWSDGLEPEADFETAFARQDERVAAGYAPFWRYRDLGLYGEQLADLLKLVDPSRVLVVRYRDIVDRPVETVDRACRFLGLREGAVPGIARENSRPYVAPGLRPRLVGPMVRAGAWAGQFAPPEVWRRLSTPVVARLQTTDAHRPSLSAEQRARLLPAFEADIRLLMELTGDDYSDWLSTRDRGSFAQRQAGGLSGGA